MHIISSSKSSQQRDFTFTKYIRSSQIHSKLSSIHITIEIYNAYVKYKPSKNTHIKFSKNGTRVYSCDPIPIIINSKPSKLLCANLRRPTLKAYSNTRTIRNF